MSGNSFEIGDLCMHKGALCLILDIQPTPLGFRRYEINNIDTGIVLSVPKHELSEVDLLDVEGICLLEDKDTEVDTVGEKVEVTSRKRHATLTEEEVDQVAKKRLSDKTEAQTRWAVKILKGTLISGKFYKY
jgi:hypothetical protein